MWACGQRCSAVRLRASRGSDLLPVSFALCLLSRAIRKDPLKAGTSHCTGVALELSYRITEAFADVLSPCMHSSKIAATASTLT